MYWRLLRQVITRVNMLTTSTELCSMKQWKIYTSLPKLASQNPIHTIPDCTLIQGHRSRYSRCSGHWIIIILGSVLGCWTLHVSSQIIPEMITTGVKFYFCLGECLQTPIAGVLCMHTSSVPTSFKLLPWDQLKIASYRSVTQPQKVLPCVLTTYKGPNRKGRHF